MVLIKAKYKILIQNIYKALEKLKEIIKLQNVENIRILLHSKWPMTFLMNDEQI